MGRAGVCLRGEENRRVRGRVGCARARRVRVGGARRAGVTRTRRRVRHPAEGGQSPLARPPVQPAPRSVTASGAETPTHPTVPGPPARAPRHLPARRTPGPARHGACATRAARCAIRSLTWPRSPPPCRAAAGRRRRAPEGPRDSAEDAASTVASVRLRRTAPSRPTGVLPHLRWGRGCIPSRRTAAEARATARKTQLPGRFRPAAPDGPSLPPGGLPHPRWERGEAVTGGGRLRPQDRAASVASRQAGAGSDQSQAAPRTPESSPWRFLSTLAAGRSVKTQGAMASGRRA